MQVEAVPAALALVRAKEAFLRAREGPSAQSLQKVLAVATRALAQKNESLGRRQRKEDLPAPPRGHPLTREPLLLRVCTWPADLSSAEPHALLQEGRSLRPDARHHTPRTCQSRGSEARDTRHLY